MQDIQPSHWEDPLDAQILGDNHGSFLANSYGSIIGVGRRRSRELCCSLRGIINTSGGVRGD